MTKGPRVTEKLSWAFDKSCPSGFCGLLVRLRGAWASSASRIADSAIAVGASTVDVPVSGANGGSAVSDGRACSGGLGDITPVISAAAAAEKTTASSPSTTVRIRMTDRLLPLPDRAPLRSGKAPRARLYPDLPGEATLGVAAAFISNSNSSKADDAPRRLTWFWIVSQRQI